MKNQKIIINICTFKRPVMIKACLDSILKVKIPEDWEVEMIIVDNDPDQSARQTIEAYSVKSSIPISYFCEKQRGIPFARNLGCKESIRKNADWILFFDDDETAYEDWLISYSEATKKYTGDVFSGPVNYIFPKGYADWLGNKGLSDIPDGTLKRRAATNNAFVRTTVFTPSGYNLQFDESMALTGGSDTDIFIRYEKMGGKIVHVSTAVVAEIVTENRLKITWRLSRQYRSSTNRVYVNKKLMGVTKATLIALKDSVRHLIEGILGLFISPIYIAKPNHFFKRKYYHALRHLAKSAGSFTGIFNMQPEPYKKTDGY